MQKIPFPTDIDFALTGRCNLRCKHCNTADTWNLQNELSLKEIFGVFEQLKQEKIFRLSLFGGEPFFHPDIIEILEKLNEYPFALTILTNATLIDKHIVDTLKKLKFLQGIQISLDGSSPEIHDWQRGRGSFWNVLRAIRLLRDNGIPLSLKAIINKFNYKDIEGLVVLTQGLGLNRIDLGDAIECGSAFRYKTEMRLSSGIYQEVFSVMLKIRKLYPNFSFGGTFAQMLEMLEDFYRNGPGKGERGTFHVCGAANNMLSIRSDGEVVPCTAFWTLKCGNIREKSLRDIWENSPVFKQIRELQDEPLNQFENCKNCDYLTYCNGGCRAAAYYASGNNLKGINPATCMVFSNWAGTRLPAECFNP